MRTAIFVVGLHCLALTAAAEVLRIEDAEAVALRQHPRIAAAEFRARAAEAIPGQVRSRLYPQVDGTTTFSLVEHGTRLGVGGINAPDLFSRVGLGLSVTQLFTDFGRTGSLVESARENAAGERENTRSTVAETRLLVRVAYFRALQAAAAAGVAKQVLSSRELLRKQASTLAEAQLRSSVDVGFAEVRVAEAGVLLTRAENEQQASLLTLASAMGLDQPGDWTLADPAGADAPIEMEVAIKEASEARPEIEALRHRVRAARLQAESDRKLKMPAITGMLAGGAIPAGDPRLRPQYAGAAVNVNVPLWNSGLFSARLQESAARAEAINRDLRELELRVRSQVRLAHLELETSRRNLAATRIFSEQAARTLRLAESRYQLGLGAIIEFTQAQVDVASAELARAAATYDVAIRRARLEYEMGRLAERP